MRYVKVPLPISPRHLVTQESFIARETGKPILMTFKSFITNLVTEDPRWMKSVAEITMAQKIINAVSDETSEIVKLEDAQWTTLKERIVDNPQYTDQNGQISSGYGMWGTQLLIQFLPFFEAVKSASEKTPLREVPEEEEVTKS